MRRSLFCRVRMRNQIFTGGSVSANLGTNKRRISRHNLRMARCRVSFMDSDQTEHSVEVDGESLGESLYEALALAIAEFREDPPSRGFGWSDDGIHRGSASQSDRTKDSPVGQVARIGPHDCRRTCRHNKAAAGPKAPGKCIARQEKILWQGEADLTKRIRWAERHVEGSLEFPRAREFVLPDAPLQIVQKLGAGGSGGDQK
jgi:hypothetical protein